MDTKLIDGDSNPEVRDALRRGMELNAALDRALITCDAAYRVPLVGRRTYRDLYERGSAITKAMAAHLAAAESAAERTARLA